MKRKQKLAKQHNLHMHIVDNTAVALAEQVEDAQIEDVQAEDMQNEPQPVALQVIHASPAPEQAELVEVQVEAAADEVEIDEADTATQEQAADAPEVEDAPEAEPAMESTVQPEAETIDAPEQPPVEEETPKPTAADYLAKCRAVGVRLGDGCKAILHAIANGWRALARGCGKVKTAVVTAALAVWRWPVLRKIGRFVRRVTVKTCNALGSLPVMAQFALWCVAYGGIFTLALAMQSLVMLAALGGVLFLQLAYLAWMLQRLLAGTKAVAQGEFEQPVNTKHMLYALKRAGENLNGVGIAVDYTMDARMAETYKKLQLIVNATQDLKIPLASVVSYTNCIAYEAHTGVAQTIAYTDGLQKQSQRLERLIADVAEVSKVLSGDVAVNAQWCDVKAVLQQIASDCQLQFSDVRLMCKLPQQVVGTTMDGDLLWRILDNLLQNACINAQEGTRVFVSLAQTEQEVTVQIKHTSKVPLDFTAEGLMERLVHGDFDDSEQAGGLGLLITQSLVELQGGTMDLETDGDLFKACVTFAKPEIELET